MTDINQLITDSFVSADKGDRFDRMNVYRLVKQGTSYPKQQRLPDHVQEQFNHLIRYGYSITILDHLNRHSCCTLFQADREKN